MRRCLTLCLFALASAPLWAQHHTGAPATAPPRPAPPPAAVSDGLGAIQFSAVNYGVPAPQLLTEQVRSDNERTRMAALSAVGVPAQYVQRGRVAMPRSIQLFFQQLGTTDELDAVLTLELEHHIVTAILVPDGEIWRRVATLFVETPFNDTRNSASTFVHVDRSLLDRDHYTAVFHATEPGPRGNFSENEARVMVFHRHAVVTISFVSAARNCAETHAASGHAAEGECTVLRRWLQPDPASPSTQYTLVSAGGRLTQREAVGVFGTDSAFDASHLRSFSCQTFQFSSQSNHFEPTTNSVACFTK
jgi:hypothetical protein